MLAKHPNMQHKLRQEILAMPIEPTRRVVSPPKVTIKREDKTWLTNSDEVNNAPYLDAFVHEILRVWSPVGLQVRQLWADASLPLGTPVKGKDGKLVDVLHLKKGTTISIRQSWLAWKHNLQSDKQPPLWSILARRFGVQTRQSSTRTVTYRRKTQVPKSDLGHRASGATS